MVGGLSWRRWRLSWAVLHAVFCMIFLGARGTDEVLISDTSSIELERRTAATSVSDCMDWNFPQNRSGFPALLNCLGLEGEAVEVGVQAGVHASAFLRSWRGRRLRLVDLWKPSDDLSFSQLFYVDIANIHGVDVRQRHRAHCEARLAESLESGRAVIVNLDSVAAADTVVDATLDFVYLDARHDFSGVVSDVHAWWPKVKIGGIFAGHDYVDGEFPEGDFFWISALRQALPEVVAHVHVTQEENMYPSFFVVKTEATAKILPRAVDSEQVAQRLYAEKSRYFKLWRSTAAARGSSAKFVDICVDSCGTDCKERVQKFTPTRSAVSTLRPFACGGESLEQEGANTVGTTGMCGLEMVLDVQAYQSVCHERCNVTCGQRADLFSQFGQQILRA